MNLNLPFGIFPGAFVKLRRCASFRRARAGAGPGDLGAIWLLARMFVPNRKARQTRDTLLRLIVEKVKSAGLQGR